MPFAVWVYHCHSYHNSPCSCLYQYPSLPSPAPRLIVNVGDIYHILELTQSARHLYHATIESLHHPAKHIALALTA
jgi:hypothetical protein